MKNILISFFCTCLLASCSEDFFDQTVPIKVPDHTPALAVTSHLTAGDSVIRVYVSHSLGILDNGQPENITDATVELHRNGQLFATLPHDPNQFYIYSAPLLAPLPGEVADYELKVSAPGYEATNAKQTMPTAVPILSATLDSLGAVDPDGERLDELTLEFQDAAREANYYAVEAYLLEEFDSFQYLSTVPLQTIDLISEAFGNRIYIQDDSFDGKKYAWRLGRYNYGDYANAKLIIRLYHVSRDEYLFEKSASLAEDADDNPFAEPVIIHNNIEGGYGIFSLESFSEVEIEL